MNKKKALLVLVAIVFGAGTATAQTEWVEYPDNPVIGPGDPGSWDPMRMVFAVHFDGAVHHLWFGGGTLSGGIDIGHATSTDGVVWTMDPANPVLTRGLAGTWDDTLIFGAGLVHDGAQYHLWYAGLGSQSGAWQGGYATSPDGTVWTKYPGNPVLTPGAAGAWDDRDVYPHAVILDDGTYRMWYEGSDRVDTQVGYAESSDGVTWTHHPDPVLSVGPPGAWDSGFTANPSVVFDGTTYHMWYTGDNGGAWAVGYAVSVDGVEWTRNRGNPVFSPAEGGIQNGKVLLEGATYHMWYTHVESAQNIDIAYATSDCCVAMDHWKFIPAAAVASGAEGAFYQTDVDVSNADDVPVEYRFLWLPRGEDNSEPTASGTFSLEAGMCVRYNNVLTEVFGLEPNSVGALAITASSPNLLAMSRTYNLGDDGAGGTYGQAMPALSVDDFIQHGETRRILFGSENAAMRTNVGCQNASGSGTMVFLDLYGSDGTSLGRETMLLRSYGNDQVNRIFGGHNPVNGYVDVTPATAGKPVYCFGSVLDNTTSDPTTIPPQ